MFGRISRRQLRKMIQEEVEVIQLADLQALTVKPNQIVVARFPKRLTPEAIETAGRNLHKAFPNNRVAVLEEGAGLQIVAATGSVSRAVSATAGSLAAL